MNCPICSSNKNEIFLDLSRINTKLVSCIDCQVVFSDPFKAPSLDFYTKADDSSSANRHACAYPFTKSHPARKFKILDNGKNRKLLDIGCGNGSFSSFVDEKGFSILAIDIDEKSLAIAESRGLKNAEFKLATIDELLKDSSYHYYFDVISMFEVFEHLDNPNEIIDKIKLLLKPNGYFIGSLPNIKRFFMWKFNMNYELPPYHLTYWTIETWEKYILSKGFKFEFGENTNYYGYISDVLSFNLKGKLSNKLLIKSVSVLFQIIKKFIETPIEIAFTKGAGFCFILRNSN